jgi:hypothetical protein
MAKSNQIAKEIVKNSAVIDSRGETDTIRLWENYRDQALLWRSIALLQIPTTLVISIFAFAIWNGSEIILNIPRNPLPGLYAAQEIPDTEFIDMATNFINLTATYQPAVARRQFLKARETLKEPMLETFDREMVGTELKAIENTNRTQLFFTDPTKTTVERVDSHVLVTMTGDRLKIVAGRQLPVTLTKFKVSMTTIPRNDLNPYGIVIDSVIFENVVN